MDSDKRSSDVTLKQSIYQKKQFPHILEKKQKLSNTLYFQIYTKKENMLIHLIKFPLLQKLIKRTNIT